MSNEKCKPYHKYLIAYNNGNASKSSWRWYFSIPSTVLRLTQNRDARVRTLSLSLNTMPKTIHRDVRKYSRNVYLAVLKWNWWVSWTRCCYSLLFYNFDLDPFSFLPLRFKSKMSWMFSTNVYCWGWPLSRAQVQALNTQHNRWQVSKWCRVCFTIFSLQWIVWY